MWHPSMRASHGTDSNGSAYHGMNPRVVASHKMVPYRITSYNFLEKALLVKMEPAPALAHWTSSLSASSLIHTN